MGDIILEGLQGKVAVVTGAGRMRSIGRPIAVQLAKAGCNIVLTGTGRARKDYPKDEQSADWHDIKSVAGEVEAAGARALEVVSNVTDPQAVDELVKATLSEFGRVDFIVNNAGAARGSDRVPVVDLAIDDWHKVMNVNLNGTFYMSRAFGRALIDQDEGGAIINISSIAGKALPPNTAAYAASKAGLVGLGRSMAREFASRGITVNVVAPGPIETDMLEAAGAEAIEQMTKAVPVGRLGGPDEVAAAIEFLASDDAAFITGHTLAVDGGLGMGGGF